MNRFRMHGEFARRGTSWNTLQRMWWSERKSGADHMRDAEERQSAIIKAGLALGVVVKGKNGFEVRT